jgi:hypothetical protein
MWEPRRLTTLWDSTACYRDSITYYTNICTVFFSARTHTRKQLMLTINIVRRHNAHMCWRIVWIDLWGETMHESKGKDVFKIIQIGCCKYRSKNGAYRKQVTRSNRIFLLVCLRGVMIAECCSCWCRNWSVLRNTNVWYLFPARPNPKTW